MGPASAIRVVCSYTKPFQVSTRISSKLFISWGDTRTNPLIESCPSRNPAGIFLALHPLGRVNRKPHEGSPISPCAWGAPVPVPGDPEPAEASGCRSRKLSSSRCNNHALDPAVLFLAHHPVKTLSGLNAELKQVPLPDELSLAEPARVSPGFKGSGGKSGSEKKENPK